MSIDNKIEQYWKGRVLFSWGKYEEMRKLRYDINHYVRLDSIHLKIVRTRKYLR